MDSQENIVATVLKDMPKSHVAAHIDCDLGGSVEYVAVPKGFELKAIDSEPFLAHPRRKKSTANLVDVESFIAYVKAHDDGSTNVWCLFDPVTQQLSFKAVFDEHTIYKAGWRSHTAVYTPKTGVEWDTWSGHNGKDHKMGQLQFAEFIESNEKDIASIEGFPSSLEMMSMATNFEANSDKSFKAKVNLQGGGVEMTFVDTDNQETVTRMKVFQRFQIGLPVFWTLPKEGEAIKAWTLVSRLKYHVANSKVTFWYELVRPDSVYELAALALIDQIRDGLGDVPLRMGTCS